MYKLPGFSKTKVENFLTQGRTNPHLLLYRYLYGSEAEKKVDSLRDAFCPKNSRSKADTSMVKQLRSRQDAALDQWEKKFPQGKVCKASMELVDRMVVGMGISSSFENGLLLDWVHGIPFINGEAVKGATRSYAWEGIENSEHEIGKNIFREIFGSLNEEKQDSENVFAGKVIFFDAYPETDRDLFDVDIITTHYGPYYTNTGGQQVEPPGDWHSPIPVPFLSINAGVVFRFALLSESEEHALKAMEWLQAALIRRGMGAKKRIGYGHFVPVVAETTDMSSKTDTASEASGSLVTQAAISLMMKIEHIQAGQIPGSASDIVNSIEALTLEDDRLATAKALMNRLNDNMLKKNRNKPWMKTLKIILKAET